MTLLQLAKERLAPLSFSAGLVPLLLLGGGCQTGGGSGPSASVVIESRDYDRIKFLVTEVFQEHGFQRLYTNRTTMTFDKAGSTMSNLLYGGWEPRTVGDRAKVSINPNGPGAFRVDCYAYRVTDRGDRLMEEEKKLGSAASGKYRKILAEVQARMASQPTGSTPLDSPPAPRAPR
jgi:hypothetical protein